MPVAWMISSNVTEPTISFFLAKLREHNLTVIPKWWMSDHDPAQMNGIKAKYPESLLLLCWWHVLHAWQQHFSTSAFPQLWQLLKGWICLTTEEEFETRWQEIYAITPKSIQDYLRKYWLPVCHLWSAANHQNHTIFEEGDTNMLVEAWHHILKGKMLEGKRNRHIDHLIYILVLEGPDLEVKHRQEIEARAQTIPHDSVNELEEGQLYQVLSQSHANCQYTVDIKLYTCDCAAFPSIAFCKHIQAVQLFFHETVTILPFISILPQQPPHGNHPTPSYYSSAQPPAQISDMSRMITGIQEKVLLLSHHAQRASSSTTIGQSLHDLNHTLNQVLVEYPSERPVILSAKSEITPNQHSWPETATVMGARPKGKRKRMHTDVYAGGERNGKKAKPDA
ncbi:hypothetical protein FIBSPDRAFT_958125 [Athelia psychrophila]|uniref:SWIM-type domain-containing protein n=1 Tax=Athelia psychrophila TaxID=1759441 RepID=A0A166EYE9_9AGAM|nr:hypothetical protein FIBSPDRAFT_958125 [Fibularhizoctonia sp. CBS 109695]